MTTSYPAFAAGGAAGVIELRTLELSHPLWTARVRIVLDHIDWKLN